MATQAKNEALAKLSQYYKRMEEFANEAEQLRKHVRFFMHQFPSLSFI